MKTFKQSIFKHQAFFLACFFLFFYSDIASALTATGGLDSIGGRVDKVSKAAYTSAKLIAGLVGLAFVISGFMQMKGAKQNNSGYGQPFITLLVGVILLSIVSFVSLSTNTAFGTNVDVSTELKAFQ